MVKILFYSNIFLLLKVKDKVVPVLNLAPLHGDVRGSITQRILKLGTRWRPSASRPDHFISG
jgi:hypothetical protein